MAEAQSTPALQIFREDTETFDLMDDAMLAALFRAIYRYWRDGEEPPALPEQVRLVFPMMKHKIDRSKARYAETCERNREKAEKRWAQAHQTDATACHGMPGDAEHANITEPNETIT